MKLDVIMVSSQFPPIYGGAGGQASLLSTYLTELGWRVGVVTLDQAEVGSALDKPVPVLRTHKGPISGPVSRLRSTMSLSFKAAQAVVTSRPKIVHIHGIYWWSILPAISAKIVGARVILKSTRIGEDDPFTVRNRRFRGLKIGWLYGLSMRFADKIVVLNQETLESAERASLSNKAVLMRNGVDTPNLRRTAERASTSRAKFGFGPSDRVILFVGYLAEHKGVLDLLVAFKGFYNSSETHLILAGPIDGFYRELGDRVPDELERLRAIGVLNIRTPGHISSSEVAELYWAADVFVLPSYAEGMPNSLAEAIVAGCRIVATRIPGITDTIEEEEAWLTETGDVAALAEALRNALDDESRLPFKAATRIHMDVVTREYEEMYSKLGAFPTRAVSE